MQLFAPCTPGTHPDPPVPLPPHRHAGAPFSSPLGYGAVNILPSFEPAYGDEEAVSLWPRRPGPRCPGVVPGRVGVTAHRGGATDQNRGPFIFTPTGRGVACAGLLWLGCGNNFYTVRGLVTERPQLVDDKVDRHGRQHRNCVGPVHASTETRGVIEDVGGQGDRRGGIHQQRRHHLAHHQGTDAREKELPIAPQPANGLALERPKAVELVIPRVSHQKSDGDHDVVPADVELRAKEVRHHLVLVDAHKPVEHPHDEEVDDGSGTADHPELDKFAEVGKYARCTHVSPGLLGQSLGSGDGIVVRDGQSDTDVLLARFAVEVTGGDQQSALSEPPRGIPTIFATGGP